MTGAFLVNPLVAAGAALGVILSAAYALTLARKVVFGAIENPQLEAIADLDGREWILFVPLVAATLVFGLAPWIIFDFTEASAQSIAQAYEAATTAIAAGARP